MIKLITLAFEFLVPLAGWFFKNSDKKEEVLKKTFDLAKKYDEQVIKNANLKKEYDDLKKKIDAV